MASSRLLGYASWAAYFGGGVGVIGAMFLLVFFAVGEPFGTLNDISAFPSLLALLVVAFALYRLSRTRAPGLSLAAFLVGGVGMLSVVVLQGLLVTGFLPFEQQLPYVLGFGAGFSLWIALASRLVREELPSRLVSFGVTVGSLGVGGSLLFWIGFLLEGGSLGNLGGDAAAFSQLNPLIILGFMLALVVQFLGPFWAIWLGRALSEARVGES